MDRLCTFNIEDFKKGFPYTIITHTDADGIAAAVLAVTAEIGWHVMFASSFGEVRDAELVLDMVPQENKETLYVVDHHPGHIEPKYKLYWGMYPASRLVYDLIKKCGIEVGYQWKVAVGCVGDGQPEAIPTEVWLKHKELLIQKGRISDKYGSTNIYGQPIFRLLSSPINAACRTNEPKLAFEILLTAETPFDIIYNDVLQERQELVKKEVSKQIADAEIIDYGAILLVKISSKYRITSLVASKIAGSTYKTVVTLNKETKKVSIRGVLSELLREKLAHHNIGGHLGFMAAEDVNIKAFLKDLHSLALSLGGI